MKSDLEWLDIAFDLARKSPDPSTQLAAIVVESDTGIGSFGVNHVVAPEDGWESDRDKKLAATIHAEVAALLRAARDGVVADGATLYGTWVACESCARAIVEACVARVVTSARTYRDTPERWQAQVDRGLGILWSNGVEVVHLEHEFGLPPIRFSGALWVP